LTEDIVAKLTSRNMPSSPMQAQYKKTANQHVDQGGGSNKEHTGGGGGGGGGGEEEEEEEEKERVSWLQSEAKFENNGAQQACVMSSVVAMLDEDTRKVCV
jgi:hypothetical protein